MTRGFDSDEERKKFLEQRSTQILADLRKALSAVDERGAYASELRDRRTKILLALDLRNYKLNMTAEKFKLLISVLEAQASGYHKGGFDIAPRIRLLNKVAEIDNSTEHEDALLESLEIMQRSFDKSNPNYTELEKQLGYTLSEKIRQLKSRNSSEGPSRTNILKRLGDYLRKHRNKN